MDSGSVIKQDDVAPVGRCERCGQSRIEGGQMCVVITRQVDQMKVGDLLVANQHGGVDRCIVESVITVGSDQLVGDRRLADVDRETRVDHINQTLLRRLGAKPAQGEF